MLVIPRQDPIEVYFNDDGQVVIKQESDIGEQDSYIYIQPNHIATLVDALNDAKERSMRGDAVNIEVI
jgi:hypothetical protein